MQTISLKINSPDTIIPILKIAIDRERRILMETIMAAKEKVNKSAGNLAVDVNKLMEGTVEHTESNEMQLIELEGEIEIIRQLEVELQELEIIEICK